MAQQGRLMNPTEPPQSKDSFLLYGNLRQPPRTWKVLSRGPTAVPAFSPWKFKTRRSSLWAPSEPHHTQVEYKRKPTTGPHSCLTAENFNKCNNNKFCLRQ